MPEQIIEGAGGVGIHVHSSGDASGPAVVLLHALGDRAADWDAVESALAPGFHVVRLDLRGHGASDPASTPSS